MKRLEEGRNMCGSRAFKDKPSSVILDSLETDNKMFRTTREKGITII